MIASKQISMHLLTLLLWIVTGSFSCTTKQKEVRAELKVRIGCDNDEIVNDIIYSVQSIVDSLHARGVALSVDTSGVECGYTFIKATDTKAINHVLTNAELWDSSKAFFGNDG